MKNEQKNTVLITGGGSGIGLETALLFAATGNTVIITGRNVHKLQEAAKRHNNIHYISCNINNEEKVDLLVKKVNEEYGGLHVLINNAGEANLYRMYEGDNTLANARSEMETNYFSIVNLTGKFLPLLKKQEKAAIINISSIVAFAPSINLPTYSATKAALHSYTQSLRLTLADNTRINVFEVMPPLVDTELARDIHSAKIPPSEVAQAILDGYLNDRFEIRVGFTETFYQLFLQSPGAALNAMNGIGSGSKQ